MTATFSVTCLGDYLHSVYCRAAAAAAAAAAHRWPLVGAIAWQAIRLLRSFPLYIGRETGRGISFQQTPSVATSSRDA